jgi:sulfur-oxidizing protein SoxY
MKTKIYSTNLGNFQRRQLLGASAALIGSVFVRPLMAAPASLESAIAEFSRGAKVNAAKVKFEIAELIDNGNAVPITVSVDSPMTDANHVVAIAVFNEKNPQREVIKTKLTPLTGRAQISTRIRLATSQKLTAIAEMNDGSFYAQTVEVVVTLAACIEE